MSKSGPISGTEYEALAKDEAKVKPLAAQEQKVASQAAIRPMASVFADIDARMKTAKAQRAISSAEAQVASATAAPQSPAPSAIPPTFISVPASSVPQTKKEQNAKRELTKAYRSIYLEVIEEDLGTNILNDLDKIRNNERISPGEKLENIHRLINTAQSLLKDSTLNEKPLLDKLLQNPDFVKKAQEGDKKGCDKLLRELILSEKTVSRSYKEKADIELNHVNMLEQAINYVGLDLDDEQKKWLKEIRKDDKANAKLMKNPNVEEIAQKLQESMNTDGFKLRLEKAYKKMYPSEYEAKARAESAAETVAAVHASSKASTQLTFSASAKAAPTQSQTNKAPTPPEPSTTPSESRKLK